MCRLAAYLGSSRPLSEIILDPRHSLIAQSQEALEAKLSVNGDGFGFAWYGAKPEPGLYKDILPAWSDNNLLSLCQHISAPLFLAHVRAWCCQTNENSHQIVRCGYRWDMSVWYYNFSLRAS